MCKDGEQNKQKQLVEAVRMLRVLSPCVNERIDEAQTIITATEELLTRCTWLEGYVPLIESPKPGSCRGPALGCRRSDGKFRIGVITYSEVTGEEVGFTSWGNIPWKQKLNTFDALPRLLIGMADRIKSVLDAGDGFSAAAENLRKAIGFSKEG